MMKTETFDAVIVGAGLSGVCMAHYLREKLPGLSYTLLEAREAMGGTWDLFRYPGVRSDSDMFTLGYGFRPWASEKSITDGESIRRYIVQTAQEDGTDRRVRYRHRLVEARWDSSSARWSLIVAVEGQPQPWTLVCRFLLMCSGYFDHEQGHDPHFQGEESFAGRWVHAQQWPEDLQTEGRRVVVIGSGATAVTLVPELAKSAASVTMLQRSPTYIVSRPAVDGLARVMRGLPSPLVHRLVRWKNVALQWFTYRLARRRPEAMRKWLLQQAASQLPADFDVQRHLSPRYDPWDQRLCLVPDGDLFASLREGKARIVTDEIESVVPEGVKLKSGQTLPADVLVKATGLQLRMAGGARLVVDGRPVDLSKTVTYKGVMYGGVPNLVSIFGYTNASWTLKCELVAGYACRLLAHMMSHGYDQCTAVHQEEGQPLQPVLDLSSGYVQRAAAMLPRQGAKAPWRMNQNYFQDIVALKWQPLEDGALRFSRAARPVQAQPAEAA